MNAILYNVLSIGCYDGVSIATNLIEQHMYVSFIITGVLFLFRRFVNVV